jgi:hypothetical protein
LTEKLIRVQLWIVGERQMSNRLSPAFHAEYIVELFNEYGCLAKVSERTNILLSSYPAEHVEAIVRYLPSGLLTVLPKRRLITPDVR